MLSFFAGEELPPVLKALKISYERFKDRVKE